MFWWFILRHFSQLILLCRRSCLLVPLGKSCIRGQQIYSLALFGVELLLQFSQICDNLANTCLPSSVDSVGLFWAILKFSCQALVQFTCYFLNSPCVTHSRLFLFLVPVVILRYFANKLVNRKPLSVVVTFRIWRSNVQPEQLSTCSWPNNKSFE